MPIVSTHVEVDVPPARLMDVITTFGEYPEFLTDMTDAVVTRTEGTATTVRFTISVVKRLDYTLELVRVSELELTWALVEGVFRTNNGSWKLEPLDGGRRTRATYTVDIDVGVYVPGSMLKTLVGRDLPRTMAEFKARAER